MSPLDLDGDFTGSEFRSHLLIEHSRNHHAHDLALPRGQRFVSLLQLGKLNAPLAHYPVAVQSLVNRVQQILIAKRLGKKLHGPGFHGTHRHRNISVAGDKNDGNPDARILQLSLEVQAADTGKPHVQNQATWSFRPLAGKESLGRAKRLRTQANRLQHALYRCTHQVIVIDHKDRGSVAGFHSLASNSVPGNLSDGPAGGEIQMDYRDTTQPELESGQGYPCQSSAIAKRSKDYLPFVEGHRLA